MNTQVFNTVVDFWSNKVESVSAATSDVSIWFIAALLIIAAACIVSIAFVKNFSYASKHALGTQKNSKFSNKSKLLFLLLLIVTAFSSVLAFATFATAATETKVNATVTDNMSAMIDEQSGSNLITCENGVITNNSKDYKLGIKTVSTEPMAGLENTNLTITTDDQELYNSKIGTSQSLEEFYLIDKGKSATLNYNLENMGAQFLPFAEKQGLSINTEINNIVMLSGVAYDEEGNPVENAEVKYIDVDGSVVSTVYTNEDGEYEIPVVAESEGTLKIEDDTKIADDIYFPNEDSDKTTAEDSDLGDSVMSLKCVVSGDVTYQKSGTAAPNCRVDFYIDNQAPANENSSSASTNSPNNTLTGNSLFKVQPAYADEEVDRYKKLFTTYSDEKGNYSLSTKRSIQGLIKYATTTQVGPDKPVEIGDEPEKEVNLTLDEDYVTIKGDVVNVAGEPLHNVIVKFEYVDPNTGEEKYFSMTTDKTGYYEIKVPLEKEGSIIFEYDGYFGFPINYVPSTSETIDTEIMYVVATEPTIITGLTYNGQEQMGCQILDQMHIETVDGSVEFATHAGTYVAKVQPKQDYVWCDGSRDVKSYKWTIARKQLLEDYFTLSGDYTYNGKDQTVSYKVEDGDPSILATTDYSIEGITYTNASEYTAKVTALESGNYVGEVQKNWTINKKQLTNDMIVFGTTTLTYNGEKQTRDFDVIDKPEGMSASIITGADWEILDETNKATNATTYTLKLNALNNYTCSEPVCKDWTIEKKQLTADMVKFGEELTYNGSIQTKQFNVIDVPEGKSQSIITTDDWSILNDSDKGTNAGKYQLSLAATRNYKIDTAWTREWNIHQKLLTSDMITFGADFTFNGTEQTRDFTVTDIPSGETESIIKSSDWTLVEGSDKGTNAKDYTLKITANTNGNYQASADVTKEWNIAQKELTSSMVVLGAQLTYNGDEQTCNFTVEDIPAADGTSIITAEDWSVEGTTDKGTNASTYTLTIQAKRNYKSSVDTTWTIAQKELTASMITIGSTTLTYNGTQQIRDFTVEDISTTTQKSIITADDWEIVKEASLDTNLGTNAGNYTLKLSAKRNYKISSEPAEVSKAWKIEKKALTNSMVTTTGTYTYNKQDQTVTYSVTDGDPSIIIDSDYTVSGMTYKDAGNKTLKITATDAGNYSGSATASWKINAKSINDITVGSISDLTYNRKAQTPNVSVTDGETSLTKGTDFKIDYSNNTNAASSSDSKAPTAKVTCQGNYTGAKDVKFTIKRKSLKDSSITIAVADATYDTTALTPAVTIKDGNDTLASSTEYSTVYKNNTNAASYKASSPPTATATGIGNYTDSISKTFTINKADSTLTLSLNSTCSLEINTSKSLIVKSYTGSADTGVTYTATSSAKTYATVSQDSTTKTNFTVKGTSKTGTTTITVKASSNNYKDASAKITVNVIPLLKSFTIDNINYYPVFSDNNPPSGTKFYYKDDDGNAVQITNVKKMSDLAGHNGNLYYDKGTFNCVTGYWESYNDAFGETTATTDYNKADAYIGSFVHKNLCTCETLKWYKEADESWEDGDYMAPSENTPPTVYGISVDTINDAYNKAVAPTDDYWSAITWHFDTGWGYYMSDETAYVWDGSSTQKRWWPKMSGWMNYSNRMYEKTVLFTRTISG